MRLGAKHLALLLGFLLTLVSASENASSQSPNLARAGVCVEDYLNADKLHGGSDYGAALNAAVQAQPLLEPSELNVCRGGDHPVFAQIVVDRPVTLVGHASALIPQASLSQIERSVTGLRGAAGSRELHMPPGVHYEVGNTIGGLGIATGTTVTRSDGDVVELSLPMRLVVHGRVVNHNQLSGVSSTAGLRAGQSVSCLGCKSLTKITNVDLGRRVITLSANINLPNDNRLNPAIVMSDLSIEGSWTIPKATDVMAMPLILFRANPHALHNSEGQMIGGGIREMTVADRGNARTGRVLRGVQGLQVCGWDNFSATNLRIENMAASGLIVGGCGGTVRESQFVNVQIRDSGDWRTGQASIELMTGYQGRPLDEINQVSFIGGGATFNYGVGLLIGTYVPAVMHSGGPRLLWFQSNFQVENGSHEGHGAGWNVGQPVDEVEIQRAVDVYFQGASLAAPGFGHAVISVQSADSLTVSESRLYAAGKGTTYRIAVVQGSPVVNFISGGSGAFQVGPAWNGGGVTIKGQGCAPTCAAWLDNTDSVAADGQSLTLSAPYAGISSDTATMEIRGGGYYFALAAGVRKVTAMGNTYNDPGDNTSSLLSMRPSESFFTGAGARGTCLITDYPGYGGLTLSGPSCRLSQGSSTTDMGPVK